MAPTTPTSEAISDVASQQLDLTSFPSIFLLSTHLSPEELANIKRQLQQAGAHVAHKISKAKVVLGALNTAKRARLELQFHNLKTEPIDLEEQAEAALDVGPRRKRRKTSPASNSTHDLNDDGFIADVRDEAAEAVQGLSQLSMHHMSNDSAPSSPREPTDSESSLKGRLSDSVLVLKREWLQDSIDATKVIAVEPYIIYHGRQVIDSSIEAKAPTFEVASSQKASKHRIVQWQSSLTHLEVEDDGSLPLPLTKIPTTKVQYPKSREAFDRRQPVDRAGRSIHASSRPALLLEESTSEYEATGTALPEMPRWVKENKIYACEREAPAHPPSADFMALLEEIKEARLLTGDEIGVRAYISSIASLAAYPTKVSSAREIVALPGCDIKIAQLFQEWQSTGHIKAVEEVRADEILKILKVFYNIWGVGPTTARAFYYDQDKQWRTLGDVIEFGWHRLTLHQQIGVKFYDDFLIRIPRAEVDYIASIITYHAKQVRDDGIECIIVGGHRRGKVDSGDVDVVISHREEEATKHLAEPLVQALEDAGWITHVLTLSEANSLRGQETVALRSIHGHNNGHDTLDKALVVWQDPIWKTREKDVAEDPKAKNPNLHRRVDIIISPWRTVGCAAMGWSSGTTFQRDLRRYARRKKNWKFDSSGVRDLATGKWLDLERWADERTRAKTCEEAERRVFDAMGLAYVEPSMRNSG